jgi:threonine dehydrogenase-like Zn-dependent dehydrogenase|tara:strand:+ start:3182 stop:3490 length:309 start_codon:yes stop_codon:yes gene_type:complete
MKQLLDKFCNLFPLIEFEIIEKEIKSNIISIESITTGEKELTRMLNTAKKDLSKFKKLHKNGKVSIEEVFDHEWRVHEMEEALMRFQDDNIDLRGEDDIFDV